MAQKNKQINECDYTVLFEQAVSEIEMARTQIARQVSKTVNSAYWNLGKLLFEKKIEGGYGSSVVNRLSIDLKEHFPDMGLSPRNLWNMKRLYERYYQEDSKLLQAVAVLPWGHNLLLLDKALTMNETLFYAEESFRKGWSREMLLNAIKMNCYASHQIDDKSNNFDIVMPAEQAGYANEVFRSSYNLGFLGITEPITEFELDRKWLVGGKSEGKRVG